MEDTWEDFVSERSIPLLFPIIEPRCAAVDSVSVTIDSAGCLVATWDSLPYQEQWVVHVRCGSQSLTDTVDRCRWELCGVPQGTPCSVSVRSRCTNLRSFSWSDWSGGDPPAGLREADAARADFSVLPNPAHGRASLRLAAPAAEGCHVELCDLTGRCLHRVSVPPAALSVNLPLDGRAAGLYLVRLITPDAVATRRLVLQ